MRLKPYAVAVALATAPVIAPLLAPLPVAAEEPGSAITAVIVEQIEAFQRNDVDEAFTHASPGIQAMFGTPDNFGAMVRRGYPMIWRPSRFEVGELQARGAGYIQTMVFQDESGRMFEADYVMTQVDGDWRIDGVYLRKLPGVVS